MRHSQRTEAQANEQLKGSGTRSLSCAEQAIPVIESLAQFSHRELETLLTQTLTAANQKLGAKLVPAATAFLLFALAAIGLTLLASWDLEGGAAAINQTGSERMRAYRIAMLLSQPTAGKADRERIQADVDAEVVTFENALRELRTGDPGRPTFLPRSQEIQQQFTILQQIWSASMKPAIAVLAGIDDPVRYAAGLAQYRRTTERFVDAVDKLVYAIERDIARKTSLLRSLQMGLIWFSIAGTVALIYLMYLMVIRPVNRIEEGMLRMEAEGSVTTAAVSCRAQEEGHVGSAI